MVPAPVACFACYIFIVYEIDRIFRSISLAHIPEREPLSGILNLRKKFNKGVGQGRLPLRSPRGADCSLDLPSFEQLPKCLRILWNAYEFFGRIFHECFFVLIHS